MTLIKLLSFLTITTSIAAGGTWYYDRISHFYNRKHDIYYVGTYAFKNTGLFKNNKVKVSKITNFIIKSANSNKAIYLLEKESKEDIVLLLFENGFNEKYGRVLLNTDTFDPDRSDKFQKYYEISGNCITADHIINNCNLQKRENKNKLFGIRQKSRLLCRLFQAEFFRADIAQI